jgi:hypothetical protein
MGKCPDSRLLGQVAQALWSPSDLVIWRNRSFIAIQLRFTGNLDTLPKGHERPGFLTCYAC